MPYCSIKELRIAVIWELILVLGKWVPLLYRTPFPFPSAPLYTSSSSSMNALMHGPQTRVHGLLGFHEAMTTSPEITPAPMRLQRVSNEKLVHSGP